MNRKHLFSALSLFVFAWLALASVGPGKAWDRFNSKNLASEDRKEKGNYALLADGTKIPCKNLRQIPSIGKGKFAVDDQKLDATNVIGYREGATYYDLVGTLTYARRIVHGKVNIYACPVTNTNNKIDTKTGFTATEHSYSEDFYTQIGETAP
jgi:hypothetical protein